MNTPTPERIYRHYRGADYRVIAVATHTETGQDLVVYEALYGERKIWVRPVEMFVEHVIVDGARRPRFTPV
ncbi:DUF1653 domain-containing protein [Micromonospora zamorensis]|uniref:DUF1653 domain-containing protein n=1 Tax=Micromonospora zamorensis TaxID=709883 RepID=UPI00367B523E